MRVLCLLLIINAALTQAGFGRSYMRSSRLCHQWKCVNTNLGFPDALPSQEEFTRVLKKLLPPGPWQDVLEKVAETCYHERSRRYTNTCPGQAILHCAVDQLNNNCPEENVVKNDACAPINSLAGLVNMFTQSRYENLEYNIPFEKRPSWFLRHYFNTKCCNLPVILNSTLLTDCGFTSMLSYYTHKPNYEARFVLPSQRRDYVHQTTNAVGLVIQSFDDKSTESNRLEKEATTNAEGLIIRDFDDVQTESNEKPDPFDCCDISHFLPSKWRKECNFKLNWEGQSRLVIDKDLEPISTTVVPTTTSTERPLLHRDIVVLPQTCDKTTCVFNKMESILTENGSVNMPIFMKLLDNFTMDNPAWSSAKARVVTTCLTKPLQYDGECDLNKLLACTFDVLTENCPNGKKNDTCRHSKQDKVCQISSSKYRPKHRRDLCELPEIVNKRFMDECGIPSLTRTEQINQYNTAKMKFKFIHKCQDLTPSTSCVLSKMGVLNKYGFLDYFKMKDKIRSLPMEDGSSNINQAYMNAFTNYRLYSEHCNSPKKVLNLLDSMLMTCPDSKRKQTPQCTKLFQNVTASLNNQDISKDHLEKIVKHYQHVFLPIPNEYQNHIYPKHTKKIVKKPIFNYGLLDSKYAPKVEIIDIKPKMEVKPQQPLVLLPVYMRVPNNNLLVRPYNDPVLRSPFWLHNAIAQNHGQSTISPIYSKVSTTELVSTKTTAVPITTTQDSTTVPISTTEQISTTEVSTTAQISTKKDYLTEPISPITEITFDLARP